jgi:hypothetical protein
MPGPRFWESTARSQSSTISALQSGASNVSRAVNSLPQLDVLGKFKLGPLDALLGTAAVVDDYRNGENWISEAFKQATSSIGSGFAGAAAAALYATAAGVTVTAAGPVLIGGGRHRDRPRHQCRLGLCRGQLEQHHGLG